MRRRLIGSALLVALLTGLGFVFRSSAGDRPMPCQQQLQKTFLQDQQWVRERVSDTLLPSYFSSAKDLRYLNETQEAVERLDDWDRQGVSLYLYERDSLLIWTGSTTLPTNSSPSLPANWEKGWLIQRHEVDEQLHWISCIRPYSALTCQSKIELGPKKGAFFILTFAGPEGPRPLPKTSFFLFLAALLMSLSIFFGVSHWFFRRGRWNAGSGLWVLGLTGMIQAMRHLCQSAPGDFWLTFASWPSGLIGPTAAEWLWQSFLLLLSMSLFRRFCAPPLIKVSSRRRYVIAFLAYFSTALLVLGSIWLLHHLVTESTTWLQFDNIFRLNGFTVATCVGACLWWMGVFLFTQRSLLLARQFLPTSNGRTVLILLSVVLLIPFSSWLAIPVSPFILALILVLYLVGIDLIFERDTYNLTGFLFLLMPYTAINASLLYIFALDRDQQEMKAYAKKLAPEQDPLLEKRLTNYRSLSPSVDQWIQAIQSDPYIRRYYTLDNTRKPAFTPTDSFPELVRQLGPEGQTFIWVLGETDTLQVVRPLQSGTSNRPYQDVLRIPSYRDLHRLERYPYIVFRQGIIVDQLGSPDRDLLQRSNQIPVGEITQTITGGSQATLYRFADQGWVLMERRLGGYITPFSLAGFFFFTFITLSLFLALANPVVRLSEGSLLTLFGSTGSLRTNIQLAVLGLIITTYVAIGWMTINSFRRSSIKEVETALVQRMGNMRTALISQIESNPGVIASSGALDSLAKAISDQYQLDLNLYNRKGQRIGRSSAPITELADKHAYMHPSAFESLRTGLEEYRIVDARWNSVSFKMVYVPLGERTSLFLGVPYYNQSREKQNDLYDFMGSLFSVYAFFLFFAAGVTVLVSKRITKPLISIRDGIAGLKLGSNEPLSYQGNDEIGELVREYNEAIQKLEESTELLRKSERESAWREMAKQVAHEIKNPLTPMKLRIQHLMRAYQQDPERAAPMVKKVSNSLIEQIDTLTRIANEFSRFAKMPKPQNVNFDLQRLLESVTTVFAEEEAGRVMFASDLSKAPVHADRDHLTRVFNNLIKNGLQAIPDDREGVIRVTLTADDPYFLVTVADNGKGIPEDIQHKVFSPNFTTKSSGTGLGLAMSRQMIEQADGRIYFETEPDVGTTFFVQIPREN